MTFELEHDAEIIAANLFIKGTADKSGIEIVERIMLDIIDLGLFSESNGRIFCHKLLKRISLSMTSNPAFRAAINTKKSEYHDKIMTHHDEIMTHHETLPTLPTLPRIHNNKSASKSVQMYEHCTPELELEKDIELEKDNKEASKKPARFIKPTLDEVKQYCQERNNRVDPEKFISHYDSNGWMVGRNKMKDWRASVRTWERNSYDSNSVSGGANLRVNQRKEILDL